MYKLNKAPYGLRHASRAWNIKLNRILQEFGFYRCSKEQSLYKIEDKKGILMVCICR